MENTEKKAKKERVSKEDHSPSFTFDEILRVVTTTGPVKMKKGSKARKANDK